MKYLDTSNNMFYESQDSECTRIPYDDEYFEQIYINARNGVVYNIDDISLPSFITREQMQSSLWVAELVYLQTNNGSQERIAELIELISPVQEEGNIEDDNPMPEFPTDMGGILQ